MTVLNRERRRRQLDLELDKGFKKNGLMGGWMDGCLLLLKLIRKIMKCLSQKLHEVLWSQRNCLIFLVLALSSLSAML